MRLMTSVPNDNSNGSEASDQTLMVRRKERLLLSVCCLSMGVNFPCFSSVSVNFRLFQLRSFSSPKSPKHGRERDTKSCERGTKGEQNDDDHGSSSSSPTPSMSPMQKVHRLESNMAFMRDQHRQMLAALQEEVITLKKKNQGDQ